MEQRESSRAAHVGRLSSKCRQGIVTTLKVVGIAAGYAASVWFIMYEVEHDFSALRPFSMVTETAAGSGRASMARKSEPPTAGAPSALPRLTTEPAAVR